MNDKEAVERLIEECSMKRDIYNGDYGGDYRALLDLLEKIRRAREVRQFRKDNNF